LITILEKQNDIAKFSECEKYVFFTLNLKTLAVKYSYDLFQFYLYFRVWSE